MAFRAGDKVHHGPSGEDWILAVDEERGEVIPAGWPESFAKAAECTLIDAATDGERRSMLEQVAESRSDHGGPDGGTRARRGRRQLAALLQEDRICRSPLGIARQAIDAAVVEIDAALDAWAEEAGSSFVVPDDVVLAPDHESTGFALNLEYSERTSPVDAGQIAARLAPILRRQGIVSVNVLGCEIDGAFVPDEGAAAAAGNA